LAKLLDGAYRTVADRAASNADLRFETVDGKTRIVVTPLDRLEDTESLRALRPAVQGRMPKAGMPDLFLEIMQRTGFAKSFTHLSERQARVEHFETSLCAALVAEAFDIGIEAVSRLDVPALRRERLAWVSQNFIRPETIAAANARIVSSHAALPLVKIWGAGDVASADGMRFTAPASAIHAGPNPKYFGQSRGVTWYNLLSNQFIGLNGIVVPGTLRDSLVLLALLLEQETKLEPVEFMTDTAAYSDAVFGLFWLLGYQFSPRLADLGDARLWRIDRKADYGPFNSLSKGTINLRLIRENWPDVSRTGQPWVVHPVGEQRWNGLASPSRQIPPIRPIDAIVQLPDCQRSHALTRVCPLISILPFRLLSPCVPPTLASVRGLRRSRCLGA